MAVLFSAFAKLSSEVVASNATVADVEVFFCAKAIIEAVTIIRDKIIFFIFVLIYLLVKELIFF
jgi:hypothetical protein